MEDFNWEAYENGETTTAVSHEDQEKAYDGTLNKVGDHEVVDGTVIAMNKREVVVNIGYKSDGIIPMSEFRYNPDLKVGDTVEVVIKGRGGRRPEGVITKVVFQGKEGTDTRPAVEAEVSENTDKFGTLQKVVNRNESASLEDAKKEAQAMLDMFKNPFWEYEVEAPDIPWIRKGDKVYINAGDIYQLYLIEILKRDFLLYK